MKKPKFILSVTAERTLAPDHHFLNQVEEALESGVTILHLKENDLSFQAFLEEIRLIKPLTDHFGTSLIIYDNPELVTESDADGLYTEQNGMNFSEIRNIIGEEKLLGTSVQTVEDAVRAAEDGADYLTVGPVFSHSKKDNTPAISFKRLKAITDAVDIPVLAAGHITKDNLGRLAESGISGCKVDQSVFLEDDFNNTLRKLYHLSKSLFEDSEQNS